MKNKQRRIAGMKTTIWRILFFMFISGNGLAAEPVDPSVLPQGIKRVDIFVLAGQSNMKGRGAIPDQQDENPRILNLSMADNRWYVARHPLHKRGAPDLIDGSDNAGVGPGLAFAQKVVEKENDVLVALVPCAVAGSWIGLWHPTLKIYPEMIRRAKHARDAFPEGMAQIRGVLWLQGESDSTDARVGTYALKLKHLIDQVRVDLDDPQLPVVVCSIGSFIPGHPVFTRSEEMNEILLSFPEQCPFVACVDARDLKDGHIGDRLHYNSGAQQIIGRRFAEAYFGLTDGFEEH
jgi:hypothetical protein